METALRPRRLGILLATPPGHPNTATVARLARAARARGDEVLLYLVDEGVRNIDVPEIAALGPAGVQLYCCAMGSQHRGVEISSRAVFSGLFVLYTIVQVADRFLAFT